MKAKKIRNIRMALILIVALLFTFQGSVDINANNNSNTSNILHWTAENQVVAAGQTSVDIVFRLDWADTPVVPLNLTGLTLDFPIGAFTVEQEDSSIVPANAGDNFVVRSSTRGQQAAVSFEINGMAGYEGALEIRTTMEIHSTAIPNPGDYIEVGMGRIPTGGVSGGAERTVVRIQRAGGTGGGNNVGGNNPGGNNPGGNNPGANNPGGNNPGANNPGGGSNVPNTRDEANMNLWINMIIIGLVGFAFASIQLVRDKRRGIREATAIVIKDDDDNPYIIK